MALTVVLCIESGKMEVHHVIQPLLLKLAAYFLVVYQKISEKEQ